MRHSFPGVKGLSWVASVPGKEEPMSPAPASTARPRPDDIVDSLTTILSSVEGEVVFVTCIDEHGYAGDSEAYASLEQPKNTLPFEHLLSFPKELQSDTILVTSRAAGTLRDVAESDLEFTRSLIEAAAAEGIEVLDHVLVKDGDYLKLRATTDLWN